jgi:hypothetical protein
MHRVFLQKKRQDAVLKDLDNFINIFKEPSKYIDKISENPLKSILNPSDIEESSSQKKHTLRLKFYKIQKFYFRFFLMMSKLIFCQK